MFRVIKIFAGKTIHGSFQCDFAIRWRAGDGWFDFQIGFLTDFDEPRMSALRFADEFGACAGDGDVARVARLAVVGGNGGGLFAELTRRFACIVGDGFQEDMAARHPADVEPKVLWSGDAQGEQVVVFSCFAGPCLPSATKIVFPE